MRTKSGMPDIEDRQHSIEITPGKKGLVKGVMSQFAELRTVDISDGFINNGHRKLGLAKP